MRINISIHIVSQIPSFFTYISIGTHGINNMKRQRSESGSADGRADKKPKTTKEATQEAEEDDTEAFQKQTGEDDEEKEKTEDERNEPTTVECSTKRKRGDDEPRSAQEQKPFICENCGASFAVDKQLKAHKKGSKKCKKTCPKCRITFSNFLERHNHQKGCTGGFQEAPSTPSPQEAPSTPDVPPPKKQKLDKTSDGRFKCPNCDATYKRIHKLTEHLKKCQPACTLCRRSFSSPLQAQKENHACLGKLCCEHCGEEFTEVKNMKSHAATCEKTCPYCYAQFAEVNILLKHITQYCLRFKTLNCKMDYLSYILLGQDERELQKENVSAITPALSASVAAVLCLAAIELPQYFDFNDYTPPLFSWLFHSAEVFRISALRTSSRPYYATQDNLLRFQKVLLWSHINVPLIKDNKPKSHTFNDCVVDIMQKKWDLRKLKSLETKRQQTYTKLDELEEVKARIFLLEHEASFVTLRNVDPMSKMVFDPASVEEAKSIWSARQIRNLKELMIKEQNLMGELIEKHSKADFDVVQSEAKYMSGTLFHEAEFQMEKQSSIVEEQRADLNRKLQRQGVKKIFTYRHLGAALREEVDDSIKKHSCGEMDKPCKHCGALLFRGESSKICCTGGKVSLPDMPKIISQDHLELLQDKFYKRVSIQLNAFFAMVENKIRRDSRVPKGFSAVALEGRGLKKFNGFYDDALTESWFVDPNVSSTDNKKSMTGGVLPDNLLGLAEKCHLLLGDNAFAAKFKAISQQYKGREDELKKMRIDFHEVLASKTGSEYTTDEAKGAVKMFYTIDEAAPAERKFTVYPMFTCAENGGKDPKWNAPIIIDDFNQLYELLSYPLAHLNPTENNGFRLKMPHRVVNRGAASDSDDDDDDDAQNTNNPEPTAPNPEALNSGEKDDAMQVDPEEWNGGWERCAEEDRAVDSMHEVLRNATNLAETTPSSTFISAKQYATYLMHHRPNSSKDPLSYNPLLMHGTLTQQFFIDMAMRGMYQRLKYHIVGRGMGYASKKDITSGKQIPPTNEISMPSSFERGVAARAQLLNDTLAIYAKYGKADFFLTMTCNPMWEEIQSNLLEGETALDRPELVHRVFDLKVKELVDDIRKKNVLGQNIAMVMVTEYQKRGLPHCHAILWNNNKTSPKDPFNIDHIVHAELPDPETHPNLYKAVSEYLMHNDCLKNRGSPCLQKGKDGKCKYCKSNFPKDFRDFTTSGNDGYAFVIRRDHGILSYVDPDVVKKWKEKHPGETTHPNQRNNRWVVPYNAYLLLKYQCHINIEAVRGILAAKYLFKYLFKGENEVDGVIKEDTKHKGGPSEAKTTTTTTTTGSIMRFLKAHCLTAADACGYLLGTKMVRIYPGVQRLHIHLEDEQRVYFPLKNYGDDSRRRDAAAKSKSTLLAFFEANERCKKHREGIPAHEAYKGFDKLLYNDVPEFFSYPREKKEWQLRPGYGWCEEEGCYKPGPHSKRNEGEGLSIGRMYWAPVKDKELHCLRLLLLCKRGSCSFEELRTIGSVVHPTFYAAAAEMGLIHDGAILRNALKECINTTLSSRAIRFTFAMIIINYMTTAEDVAKAWAEYEFELCAPPLDRVKRQEREEAVPSNHIYPKEKRKALLDMQRLLKEANVKTSMEDLGLPTPPEGTTGQSTEFVLNTERYDEGEMLKKFEQIQGNLNEGQQNVFNSVKESVEGNQGKVIFLQGAAGTGKTFLYQACLYWARSRRARAKQQQQQQQQQPLQQNEEDRFSIAVATSGIAATLLPGGRTAHSRFKIPIDLEPNSKRMCGLDDDHVELLRRTDLIVWDEVVMAQKASIEVVDRTLQRLRGCSQPFGGVTVLLGGDFRQILPVPGANKGSFESISISLHNSYLWNQLTKMSLTQVMRVKDDDAFREYLMKVGDGSVNEAGDVEGAEDTEAVMQVPHAIIFEKKNKKVTEDTLIDFTFPDIKNGMYENCALLCPTNARQVYMNEKILSSFPGETITRMSEDTCKDPGANEFFTTEALNAMNHARLPPHILNLKVNCIVMLLKNLDPAGGLCNGTRLVVKEVKKNILVCTHLAEECEWRNKNGKKPETVAIPRLPCDGDAKDLTIDFVRQQFPVRLSFAMTINKSQGQTLRRVGLDVSQSPCFSHGHLYVAMSRVCSRNDIKICLPPQGDTNLYNCVHQEVISAIEESVGGIKMKVSKERRNQLKRDLRLTEAVYAKAMHERAANPSENPAVVCSPDADGSPIDDKEHEINNPACGRSLVVTPWTKDEEEQPMDFYPFTFPEGGWYVSITLWLQ